MGIPVREVTAKPLRLTYLSQLLGMELAPVFPGAPGKGC